MNGIIIGTILFCVLVILDWFLCFILLPKIQNRKKKPPKKKAQKPSKPKRQKKTVRYKTKIVYRDRIQYKDKIVYRDKEPKIIYKDKIVYKDAPKPPPKVVYVDKPIEKIVYKDRVTEKPVEKIVYKEKIVEKPVEKIVYVDRPIEKIVYRDNPTSVPATVKVTQPAPQTKSNKNVLLNKVCSSAEVYHTQTKEHLMKNFLTRLDNLGRIRDAWVLEGKIDIQVVVSYVSKKGNTKLEKTILISAAEFDKFCQENYTPEIERSRTSYYREQILKRDNYTCKQCGHKEPKEHAAGLHIDHRVPVSLGGLTHPLNLQVLCANCNLAKGDNIG